MTLGSHAGLTIAFELTPEILTSDATAMWSLWPLSLGFTACSSPGLLRATTHTSRAPSDIRCVADRAEILVLQQLNDAFWASKRAQLQADADARLRELDELQARETTLAAAGSAPASAVAPSAELVQLRAELEAEKARSAQLEQAVAQARLDGEVALQKVNAFWIERAHLAPSTPSALSAAIDSAAAASSPPVAVATDDIVKDAPPVVPADMTLRELRAKLLAYGLGTAGLKSELHDRLQLAMLDERQQTLNWDPSTLSWK